MENVSGDKFKNYISYFSLESYKHEVLEKLRKRENELTKVKREILHLTTYQNAVEEELEQLKIELNILKVRSRPDVSYWSTRDFSWTPMLHKILKEKYNFDTFRQKQLAAINAIMSQKDVIVILPSGGGKSLTYQVPAFLSEKMTLVISPMISLIADQLLALQKMGIEATTLNSHSAKSERKRIQEAMIDDAQTPIKLLYVTPEWITRSKMFLNYLLKCYQRNILERIVIDEVHCCSTLGHDYRPHYGHLGFLKDRFPGVPLLALTGTATSHVLEDFQKLLNIREAVIISSSLNRSNLYYKVVSKPEKNEDVVDYLEKIISKHYKGKCGIIYASSAKDCLYIASSLKRKNIKIEPYYANLISSDKKRIHTSWLDNHCHVIVATNAFGMGIDKPDVRFVIHYNTPKTLEALYQESGRAGRNGVKSDSIVMFSLFEVMTNIGQATTAKAEKDALKVLHYCLNGTKCRRKVILTHFEEKWCQSMCQKMCDICKDTKRAKKIIYYDLKPILQTLVQIIVKIKFKVTLNNLVTTWFEDYPPKITKTQAIEIIAFLIDKHHFLITKASTTNGTVSYIETNWKLQAKNNDKEIVFGYLGKLKGYRKLNLKDVDVDEPSAKRLRAEAGEAALYQDID